MERLTYEKSRNRWDEGKYPTKYTSRHTFQEVVARLAAYEDTGLEPEEATAIKHALMGHEIAKITEFNGISVKRLIELAQAEKDGRLVVLPCRNGTVFTIEEDFFNCDQCKHKASARYQSSIGRISCGLDNGEHCPLRIEEHEVEGFEISFGEKGDPLVSLPGEYGYEGLETYSGFDGKCYYAREEAEAALKKMEEGDNEAD